MLLTNDVSFSPDTILTTRYFFLNHVNKATARLLDSAFYFESQKYNAKIDENYTRNCGDKDSGDLFLLCTTVWALWTTCEDEVAIVAPHAGDSAEFLAL